MRHAWLRSFTVVLCLFFTQQASALVEGSLGIQKRWIEWKADDDSTGIKTMDTVLGVHFDPIPLVPVSFGLSYGLQQWDKDDLGVKGITTATTAEGSKLSLEVKAWLPIPIGITPYAKIGVPILSTVNIEIKSENPTSTFKYEYSETGFDLAVGVRKSLVPLIGIFFELGMGSGSAKVESAQRDGADLIDVKDPEISYTTMMLGVHAGI